MIQVLFICLGNICRSPSAEAIFMDVLHKNNAEDIIYCESAGILSVHAGQGADSRMKQHALKRGYTLLSISSPIDPLSDFDQFDYIIGMDTDNIASLHQLARREEHKQKIHLMTDFCTRTSATHVPDPYYGGAAGFERVLDILEDACNGLYAHIRHNNPH